MEMLGCAQNGRNRNRLLVFAVVIPPDGCSDRRVEEVADQVKARGLRLPNERRAHGSGPVRVVNDERSPSRQAFADRTHLPLDRFLNVAADMFVGPREMLLEVARLPGPLQTDEDYCFRHFSNFAGRAPCRTAPCTGT